MNGWNRSVLLAFAFLLFMPFVTSAADKPKPNMLHADERNDVSGGAPGNPAAPVDMPQFLIEFSRHAQAEWEGRIPNIGDPGRKDGEAGSPGPDWRPSAADGDAGVGNPAGDDSNAEGEDKGFWGWLTDGAADFFDRGRELVQNAAEAVQDALGNAVGVVVDTAKEVAAAFVDATGKAADWAAENWEFVAVTTAGVALTVGGVFFPPLLPVGVSILAGEAVSGAVGYAFGVRGRDLLREMAIGGALSAIGFGVGAVAGKVATTVARLAPVAKGLSKVNSHAGRAANAAKSVLSKGTQALGTAGKWVKNTSLARTAANVANSAGNALRSAAGAVKHAGGALRSAAAGWKHTPLTRAAAGLAKHAGNAARSMVSALRHSSPFRAVTGLAKSTRNAIRTLAQSVKKSTPVHALAGATRHVGQRVGQPLKQMGSAVSRNLTIAFTRTKAAAAAEGFAVSAADDKARGKQVDYRKAVMAAMVSVALIAGGSQAMKSANTIAAKDTTQTAVAQVSDTTSRVGRMDPQLLSKAEAGDNVGVKLRAEGTGKVRTPYGEAVQTTSQEAIEVKHYAEQGGTLFRAGQLGRSHIADGQFWAPESPFTPGYADKYGVDFQKIDFVIGGKLKDGSNMVTRPAPGLGNNQGGAIEVVTNPNSVLLDFFHMP
jgi:hypothetical protein